MLVTARKFTIDELIANEVIFVYGIDMQIHVLSGNKDSIEQYINNSYADKFDSFVTISVDPFDNDTLNMTVAVLKEFPTQAHGTIQHLL